MEASSSIRILSVCRPGGALYLRNAILEKAGFAVFPAVGMGAALAALEDDLFHLVVIGHLYTAEEKDVIAGKAKSRGMKVLCMHAEALPPRVPLADASVSSTQPEELVSLVHKLTAGSAASHTATL